MRHQHTVRIRIANGLVGCTRMIKHWRTNRICVELSSPNARSGWAVTLAMPRVRRHVLRTTLYFEFVVCSGHSQKDINIKVSSLGISNMSELKTLSRHSIRSNR